MSQVLLQAIDLCRRFDQRSVLDQVSMTISCGERIAVKGPSGSGKSLLLRSLAMLERVDSGDLFWKGNKIADQDVPRFRSQVLYVQQRAALFEGTVESVLKSPYLLTIHRDREYSADRIAAWLNDVGRSNEILRQPHAELSGGEAQLVALLRAIQLDPRVLLLDEATAAIDPVTKLRVEKLILDWQAADTSRAFVWVSHDPLQSDRMTQRAIVLSAPGANDDTLH